MSHDSGERTGNIPGLTATPSRDVRPRHTTLPEVDRPRQAVSPSEGERPRRAVSPPTVEQPRRTLPSPTIGQTDTSPTFDRPASPSGDESDNEQGQDNVAEQRTQLEKVIAAFRDNELYRIEAINLVSQLLDGFRPPIEEEAKNRLFDQYLEEINSSWKRRGGYSSAPTKVGKRQRSEISDLGRQDFGESDDDAPKPTKRSRLQRADMPWIGKTILEFTQRESNLQTIEILEQFSRSEDHNRGKFLISTDSSCPTNVPTVEWDKVLRGEVLSLDHFFTVIHGVGGDEERKGSIGDTTLTFGPAEAKRKIKGEADWISAWEIASDAIAFIFPHRFRELLAYGRHMRETFRSTKSTQHRNVLSYDLAVRRMVKGGQKYLLTDYQVFANLYNAFISASGSEFLGDATPNSKPRGQLSGSCRMFNTKSGCTYKNCKFKHTCKICGKAHSSTECPDPK